MFRLLADICFYSPVEAFQGDLSASFGYDDNVVQSENKEGAGYMLYRIGLSQRLAETFEGSAVDVYADASYQDYFNTDGNYVLKAGSVYIFSGTDVITPNLYVEGLVYRDQEYKDDDYDQIKAGGRLEWLISGNWTVNFYQAVSWQNTNDLETDTASTTTTTTTSTTSTTAGSSMMMNMGQNRGHNWSQTSSGVSISGVTTGVDGVITDDGLLSETSSELIFYPGPSLGVGGRVMYHQMWATDNKDDYREPGGAVFASWSPSEKWKMILEYTYLRAAFINVSDEGKRVDHNRFAYMKLARYFDPWEASLSVRWTDIDSTVESQTYQRALIQCGISWSF